MQITRQSEYAIRALMELAAAPEGAVIQSRSIAEKHRLPEKFLNKTIQILVRAGYIKTLRGMKGGIRLTVDPGNITIADVIQAIEGKIALNPCLAESYFCENSSSCRVHGILKRAQDAMIAELSKETLADLVREDRKAAVANQ
ncbi:MAG: RrF2 family transcriptional regulator [Bacillota bacterium]